MAALSTIFLQEKKIPEVYSQIFVTVVTVKIDKVYTTTSKFNKQVTTKLKVKSFERK